MNTLVLVLIFLAGLCFGIGAGICIDNVLRRQRNIGTLIVECSDPDDGPYLFLDLDLPAHKIINEKQVTVKVKPQHQIHFSHK